MTKHPKNVFSGKPLSPGMGKGRVMIYRDLLSHHDEFYDIADDDVAHEIQRLKRATRSACDDLESLAAQVEEELDASLADVFRAHNTMIQDPMLTDELEKEIGDEGISAGLAVKNIFRRWERRFRSMEAEFAQQKGDDMRDLSHRLLAALAGVRAHALGEIPRNSVLVARHLLPSDTIQLAQRNATAVLLETGGTSSHAALFAREFGLPCISGLHGICDTISPDAQVLVDADNGKVIIDPTPEQLAAFDSEKEARQQARLRSHMHAKEPAITLSGKQIAVMANVGCGEHATRAFDNGAEGIGLYRIEQFYLRCLAPPTLDELLREMRRTLEPAGDHPVFIRLLDVGGDKRLSYVENDSEPNPALGQRGIRFLLRYPDLLETQLQALLQLRHEFDVHILVPMVTFANEIRRVRDLLGKFAEEYSPALIPPLGAMIETPAAALSARSIAEYVDFLSVGTNDLTQYTLAADRENSLVEDYFDDTHQAIFRLLQIIHEDVPDKPLSVCGELAGNPAKVAELIQCGVSMLSVAPTLIGEVKEAIRQAD